MPQPLESESSSEFSLIESGANAESDQLDYANLALGETDNFDIDAVNVYDGKVRTVYELSPELSARVIAEQGYEVPANTTLMVMIISDRISAFDANWQGEKGLAGVPGKGAALNAMSQFWFKKLKKEHGIENHLVDTPHPLVWIVAKAEPVKVEGVVRQYLTGSMWRSYAKGQRVFGEVTFPDGLVEHQKLDDILVTPTTKGTLKGIPGVAELEDAEVTITQIKKSFEAFQFQNEADVQLFVSAIMRAFSLISEYLNALGILFVDTKFELGYINGKLTIIDEAGTADSSRMWDAEQYIQGNVVQQSKEYFREALLKLLPAGAVEILISKSSTVEQRKAVAAQFQIPLEIFDAVAQIYSQLAELITGESVPQVINPKEEIHAILASLGLLKTNE